MSSNQPAISEIPSAPDAEQCVLGAALLRPRVAAWLQLEPRLFADPKNRLVWTAMQELAARSEAVDEISIADELGPRKLDAIGGLPYLSHLALRVPTADNVEHYAGILRRTHVTREVLLALGDVDRLIEDGEDGEALRDELMARLARIAAGERRGVVTWGDTIRRAQERLSGDEPDDTDYVATGVPRISLPISKTTALGADPGVGKTSLVLAMARGVADRTGMCAVVCTWEDPETVPGWRGLAHLADVDASALQRRRADLYELQRARDIELPPVYDRVFWVDCRGRTWGYAAREIRALAHQHDVVLVAADYLQRMNIGQLGRGLRADQRLAQVVDEFDALVADIGAAGLMVTQFSKYEGEPTIRNFREAPALAQICKLALLVWELEPGTLRIVADKQNEGVRGGGATLSFDGGRQRFDEVVQDPRHPHAEGA